MQNDWAYYTNNKQKRYRLNKWISILLVEEDGLIGINYNLKQLYIIVIYFFKKSLETIKLN